VVASLAAASLDDRITPNPEKLDLDRGRSMHVGFNTGPHTCAGIWLARLELKIFLEEWLQRMPPFRVAPDFKPKFRLGPVIGLQSLELTW
jgi:cytochrome P450